MRTTILALLLALCLTTCALAAPAGADVEVAVDAVAAEYGLTEAQYAISWRCDSEAYDHNGDVPVPAADAYLLPLNLHLYALAQEGASASPEQTALQEQSLTTHDPAAGQALIARLGTFRAYKSDLLTRFAPHLNPADDYYTDNRFPTVLLAGAMQALLTNPEAYGPALTLLQCTTDTPLQQALPELELTIFYSSDADVTAAVAAIHGEKDACLAVSLMGAANADAVLAQLVRAIADCAAEEAAAPPVAEAAEPAVPAQSDVLSAPEVQTLPWYFWVGIGLAAVMLVLLALELRAAHRHRVRRRIRQANRDAYLRARAQEEHDMKNESE